MKLHYSQTHNHKGWEGFGFTTLWNYTILKRTSERDLNYFGFTTLWNYTILKR